MYMDNVLENFNFIGISIGILVFLLIILLAKGYRKASPDKAFIISGPKKEPRALIGRSGFMIPFVERMDSLYLKQVTVEVNTPGPVPTKDLINVNVEAVFKIQICTDVAGGKFARAMINFLNKDPQQIIDDTRDSLQGNLREIIGTMNLADLIREKDKLADAILNAAGRDMDALGLQIVTCNILKFTDQSGAIDDMGAYNIEAIKREAANNRAKARQEIATVQAKADQEIAVAQAAAQKIATEARVNANLEIAKKENELALEQARLKTVEQTEKAKADAAFNIESAAQQKSLDVAIVEAEVAKAKSQGALREQEVALRAKALEAEINKKADAELYRRTKEAEAARRELEEQAQAQLAKAQAEAKAREEEARGLLALAEAEAKAIQLKGEAEAVAIHKKAEAMKQYEDAAKLEMLVSILPDMAKAQAEAISGIKDITIFSGSGGAGSDGISGVSQNVGLMMTETFETVKKATGVDLTNIMNANSLEAKTTRNINVTGLDNTGANIIPTDLLSRN